MTRRRFNLTYFEWEIIAPLLPNKPRGMPRVEDRRVLIHALVDAEAGTITLHLTGGQIADCTESRRPADELGEGDILLAEQGDDSNAIRAKAATRRPTFRRRQIATPPLCSRVGSIGNEILSRVSSTGSNSSEASPRHMTISQRRHRNTSSILTGSVCPPRRSDKEKIYTQKYHIALCTIHVVVQE